MTLTDADLDLLHAVVRLLPAPSDERDALTALLARATMQRARTALDASHGGAYAERAK